MGIMGFLRDRMGKILAFFIGFALLAFIIGEVVRSGGSFFRDDRNELGNVSGEKVAYDEFAKKVEQNSTQFRQQSGQGNLSPQITSYIQETTWNQMISQLILKKEVDKLGLVVSDDEAKSMVSGDNPNPQIVQAFGDPKTGQVDKNKLNTFLNNLAASKADDPVRQQWSDFISQMIEAKLSEKYVALVTTGLYVNSLEAKDDYEAKNKLANFKYTVLTYASVPDSKITVTDGDYQSYYDEHKNEFKNQQETRTFDYVSFNAAPSSADSAAIKAQADKLVTAFKATKDDSLFVQINAETKAPLVYVHKGRLEPKLDSVMFNESNGFVYGPYLSTGSYKIAKLVDARTEPDSVKARHILIDDRTIGVEKAMAKADSLKKLIQGGKSFAELANMFSVDKNSAVKGGDLGTFGRGAMIPVFEDAVFSGKKGDLKIVASQYGVHLIEIEDQKGSSKVVKVAIVDVPLKASSQTQTTVYSKAQGFLGSLTKDNFDEEAKKAGIQKKTATDVRGVAAALPGIDNAREIVRWAFNAENGDFSDKVYISDNQYIVAHLVMIKPKGILPLDAVKKQIEPMVKNKVKAKVLTDKFAGALNGVSSIDQVAQKVGSQVTPLENIVFANPVIPGSSAEYKVIGTVFGSQPNKLSKPVEGQQGVYVFVLNSFTNPPALTNAVREKQQMAQTILQSADAQIFEALKDKATIKDNRAKFL
ncbi:peptidyl-prolyl cis-trans isomerase D [Mucilaginibacter frigoritolerans]|uniref:Periplasmic chaperone PpiD n=1 Tax=Mucilaginibacter frigoritolerans TaxID=652788 RepID=A0A562U447_9SPHI|nr:peptidylprolyl isomerase [Mucilaginibacter frigoritolerans]TWI99870.1 peptidyl-prolyl cis-trans isomerase D [Mucilaginibacter frigoritolerans]